MRKNLFILFFITVVIHGHSQIITDRYTPERDLEFYKLSCQNSDLSLKRVLTKGTSYSSRQGRELLIVTDSTDSILYEFKNISGYSSLFLDEAQFNILNNSKNDKKQLIIQIEPWEGTRTIWIYQIDSECKFYFKGSKVSDKYWIEDNHLVIETNAVCNDWQDCVNLESALYQIDNTLLKKIDYYEIRNTGLVNVNEMHKDVISQQKDKYRMVIQRINNLEEKGGPNLDKGLKSEYSTVKKRLLELIENY